MHDGVWAFLIVFVCIMGLVKIIRIRASSGMATGGDQARLDKFSRRLDKIEQRMANVETIVLEAEKHRQFERAL
ncbi:MAG: hypothetical protein WCK47_05285 [bacterium]|nr:hypothetical protein [Candidatus Sumerlaeota bacterium]